MKRKYPKTNGYYVYSHSIDGIVYFGVSKQQPCKRWIKALYKTTALEPYLDRWDDEIMVHTVIKDGLTRGQAYALEDYYIQNTQNCINKRRSGFIWSSDEREYKKQYHEQHREEHKLYMKRYHEQHREKCLEQMKQYNKEHKEEIKEYKKKWYQERKKRA